MSFVPFVKIPVDLLKSMTSRDVHVYGAIASHAKDGIAFPGQRRLAARTQMSERNVRSAVSALAEARWLTIEHEKRSHGHYRNRYHLGPTGARPGRRRVFYANVPVRLIEEGTSQQVHVFGVIQHHANTSGIAHPTQEEIGEEWGHKVRQTRTVIKQLTAGGWFVVAPRVIWAVEDDPFGDLMKRTAQHEYRFPAVGMGGGSRR